MFGVKRSFGIAVLCAVGSVVAAPVGVAGAQAPVNQPPIVDVSPKLDSTNRIVAIGESITLTLSATDPEGGPITWGDWFSPGPYSAFPEVDPTGTIWTLTCEQGGPYYFGILAIDDTGQETFFGDEILCVPRPTGAVDPAPPVPGKRTVVPVGTTVTLKQVNANAGMDSEWRTTGVPGVASTKDSFTRTFDVPGLYGIELQESNEFGAAKQWVGYRVIGPPTASVSPTPADPKAWLRVPLGSTVTFDGSGSRSPGGGSLSYRWLTSGTSGVAGDGVSFARKFDKPGNFGVELIVTDELGDTAKRWVGVTVFKSESPVVSVTPAPANPKDRMKVKVGQTVTFDGRRSRDPDGGAVTYQWRSTGVRGVAGTANTYSRKFDKAGLYGVELIVIDDEGHSAKRWVGLTVAP